MAQDADLSVIDWTNVFETFCRDLFSFLGHVHVEGRTLTEEERTQALSAGVGEYAVVKSPTSLKR